MDFEKEAEKIAFRNCAVGFMGQGRIEIHDALRKAYLSGQRDNESKWNKLKAWAEFHNTICGIKADKLISILDLKSKIAEIEGESNG